MSTDRLLDALGEVKDEYILEANESARKDEAVFRDTGMSDREEERAGETGIRAYRRRHSWIKGITTVAAVLILSFAGLNMMGNMISSKFSDVSQSLAPESAEIHGHDDENSPGGLYTALIVAGCVLAGAGVVTLIVRKRSGKDETSLGEE